MTLAPYQQRVVDEKRELDERIDKLAAFFKTEAFGNLPTYDRTLMRQQHRAMDRLSVILRLRIQRFKTT